MKRWLPNLRRVLEVSKLGTLTVCGWVIIHNSHMLSINHFWMFNVSKSSFASVSAKKFRGVRSETSNIRVSVPVDRHDDEKPIKLLPMASRGLVTRNTTRYFVLLCFKNRWVPIQNIQWPCRAPWSNIERSRSFMFKCTKGGYPICGRVLDDVPKESTFQRVVLCVRVQNVFEMSNVLKHPTFK